MTISLLRRIWQKIHVPFAASPRQRLTGFEPLEPRMVLSGFAAFFAPDYFSPPAGDFSHIERSGAEIARPSMAFGGNSEHNSFGPFAVDGEEEYRFFATGPSFARPVADDLFSPGRGNDNWLSGSAYDSPAAPFGSFQSPLPDVEADGETSYEIDSDSSSDFTSSDFSVIKLPPVAAPTSITYISFSPLVVDRLFADVRGVAASASYSAFTPMATMSTMSPMSTSYRSLTDRDYTPVSAGGAVERHEDVHDYASSHGSPQNPPLAFLARPATTSVDHGASNSSADAALVSQTIGGANSVMSQSSDGSRVDGQSGGTANGSADHAQNELLDLTDGERLKLKRKLAESTTELDEASNSTKDRSEQYDDGNAQVAYDSTRAFDVTALPNGQLRQVAGGELADDGLIEVLAEDLTAVIASGDVVDQAAANRQIVMEPAVATYQAFETIVDGEARVEAVADAARLAGAVAMSGQPVAQAE